MSKSFEVKLNRDPDEIIAQAREAAHKNGIQFTGDGQTGHFVGHGIEGSYLILDNVLNVNIAKKPFVVPWGMIESKLRAFFA